MFTIGSVDHAAVNKALSLDMDDYEDALQAACALSHGAEVLITNNIRDFSRAPVQTMTSAEFVSRFCNDNS